MSHPEWGPRGSWGHTARSMRQIPSAIATGRMKLSSAIIRCLQNGFLVYGARPVTLVHDDIVTCISLDNAFYEYCTCNRLSLELGATLLLHLFSPPPLSLSLSLSLSFFLPLCLSLSVDDHPNLLLAQPIEGTKRPRSTLDKSMRQLQLVAVSGIKDSVPDANRRHTRTVREDTRVREVRSSLATRRTWDMSVRDSPDRFTTAGRRWARMARRPPLANNTTRRGPESTVDCRRRVPSSSQSRVRRSPYERAAIERVKREGGFNGSASRPPDVRGRCSGRHYGFSILVSGGGAEGRIERQRERERKETRENERERMRPARERAGK